MTEILKQIQFYDKRRRNFTASCKSKENKGVELKLKKLLVLDSCLENDVAKCMALATCGNSIRPHRRCNFYFQRPDNTVKEPAATSAQRQTNKQTE